MKTWYFFLCSLFAKQLLAQDNIVANPSFEQYANTPIGWYYKGEHFTYVMKYWNSPTAASPDLFGPKTRVPSNWADKGFGEQSPHAGKSMAGLTVYGCNNGKPHCREYIQILLNEPVVIGQRYLVEFWVSHLPHSLQVNNIGAYFSKVKINKATDEPIYITPQVFANEPIVAPNWVKISGEFTATEEYDYLILGNFFDDKMTTIKNANAAGVFNFGYYYVDDVAVKKIPPYIKVPIKDDDLTKITIEKGKKIVLKEIYFDDDKYELIPRSFIELRKLISLMNQNPMLIIEIAGYTDSNASATYNLNLSRQRAKSVADFLIYNGIEKKRIRTKGFGESKPVANNDTEEGRQLNRRVEFLIISK